MKSNPVLRRTIILLEREARKKGVPIWRDASRYLASGSSRSVEVNVGHLARVADKSSALFVPG